jgi:hypothetical protein
MVGIGVLAIPGLGVFIAAGPIMAALAGAAGGLTGALIGLGIPEYEAKRYEGKVKDGHPSVHPYRRQQRARSCEEHSRERWRRGYFLHARGLCS